MVDKQIKELSFKLINAETDVHKLQQENCRLIQQTYRDNYTIENQKKRIEDLGKTLNLYERENKAMRELLSIWI